MRHILFVGEGEEPTKAYAGDAGFDLYCSETTEIPHGHFRDVPCGISIELPPRVWIMITGRSSTLRNRQLLVTQGIIDNGYRGPIYAGVQNLGRLPAVVEKGERIAQMIPFELTAALLRFRRVQKLSESDRGDRGFGSTGA
jgi:dUTP pyrophosphatase